MPKMPGAESATTAETQPRSPISPEARAGSSARGQDLPLAQRCPEQIKPGFPERAREDDIIEGRVSARLHLDAAGRVTEVEILSAEPPGYFEREVRRAALRWRCQGSGQADSLKVPFRFELPGH